MKCLTVVVAPLAADDEDGEVVRLEALGFCNIEPADHLTLHRAQRLRQGGSSTGISSAGRGTGLVSGAT